MTTVDSQVTPAEFARALSERPYVQALRKGSLDLRWFTAKPGEGVWGTWGSKAEPSRRGLTLMDVDAASGLLPGPVGPPVTAPRGAGLDPEAGVTPWEINDKWELWAENLTSLYEEACSRQWNATSDIDWHRLEPLPPDMERALCQFCTFLTMAEYLATDVLAPWLPKFNTYFHEIKLFIASQAMDEARHTEVFRKRALANGGGLGMAIALGGALKLIEAPAHRIGRSASNSGSPFGDNPLFSTWRDVSYCIHVVFEGAVLSIFRFGEFLGRTDVDKSIFRMVMQDEARHVAYGTMHLKYLLEGAPDPDAQREDLHRLADLAEMFFTDLFFMQPATVESLAVLAGGGVDGVGEGIEVYKDVYRKLRAEYLSRTASAGLDRRDRCFFPAELPF